MSKFLGHAYGETLHEELYDCCVELGLAGIHQLSMDGPNVNWKAYDLLNTKVEWGTRRKLLDIGSCGLHVLHNAFCSGMTDTGWDVEHTLGTLRWRFKDAPARREDFSAKKSLQVHPLPSKVLLSPLGGECDRSRARGTDLASGEPVRWCCQGGSSKQTEEQIIQGSC